MKAKILIILLIILMIAGCYTRTVEHQYLTLVDKIIGEPGGFAKADTRWTVVFRNSKGFLCVYQNKYMYYGLEIGDKILIVDGKWRKL